MQHSLGVQHHHRRRRCFATPARSPAGLEELAAAGTLEGDSAKEQVLTNQDLMRLIFGHLCLEDLCRSAMVRARWREITANPEFWRTINLRGRTLMVSKVGRLVCRGCWLEACRGQPEGLAGGAHVAKHSGGCAVAFWRPTPPPLVPLRPAALASLQVRHLLSQHTGVQCLNARGVAFTATDLSLLLPKLKCVAAVLRLRCGVAMLRCPRCLL